MAELERRFPRGYAFFGIAPSTETGDPMHVFAEYRGIEEFVLLAGYSTMFFAQKSSGFFKRTDNGDDEETDE